MHAMIDRHDVMPTDACSEVLLVFLGRMEEEIELEAYTSRDGTRIESKRLENYKTVLTEDQYKTINERNQMRTAWLG